MNKTQQMILIICFLFSGSSVTIVKKVLSKIKSLNLQFRHAWIYQNIMYFSESMTYFVYKKFYNDKEFILLEENKNKKPPPLKLIIYSTIAAYFHTILTTFGLLLLPGSVYQMFRSSIIIITFILSFFLTKNKHKVRHYFGIVFTLIGLILIAFSTYENNNYDKKEIFLGIITTLLGIFSMAFNYILEENITKNYLCHPMQCIYLEGFYGFILNCLTITLLYFIHCEKQNEIIMKFCNEDEEYIRGENYFFAIKQSIYEPKILICILLYSIFVSTTNNTGCAYSKITSGTSRAVVDTLRCIFVWIFFMIPFNNDELIETFKLLQFIGFIFLIIGNVFYNNLIHFHFSEYDINDINEIIKQLGNDKILEMKNYNKNKDKLEETKDETFNNENNGSLIEEEKEKE